MDRFEIFYKVIGSIMKYNFDDLDEYEEAVKCTDLLLERADDLTMEEIDKFLFNRYEDYLY